MPTPDSDNSAKALLRAAQDQIILLQRENQSLHADLDSILEAQVVETEQMVQMSEQLWKLEDALLNATYKKDAALLLLRNLKTNMIRIKTYAEESLAALRQNKTSRLAMAAQVYEIKSLVDTLGLEKK